MHVVLYNNIITKLSTINYMKAENVMLHIGVPPPPTERSDELLQLCVSVEHVNIILNKNSACI